MPSTTNNGSETIRAVLLTAPGSTKQSSATIVKLSPYTRAVR